MTPNAMLVLRGLGLEDALRAIAFEPVAGLNREHASGALTNELPMAAQSETRYGAPFLLMHRADLHAALARKVPPDVVRFGRTLTGYRGRGDRDPRPAWVDGNVALLGDACHPMTPYMAQGAASALEDAAVLSRCLQGARPATLHKRLRQYERVRKPRASQIQAISSANTWMRQPTDPGWVYGYDAWTVPR